MSEQKPVFEEFPKVVYRGEESRLVGSRAVQDALGAEWQEAASDPVAANESAVRVKANQQPHEDFPQMLYNAAGESKVAATFEQAQAFGPEWKSLHSLNAPPPPAEPPSDVVVDPLVDEDVSTKGGKAKGGKAK